MISAHIEDSSKDICKNADTDLGNIFFEPTLIPKVRFFMRQFGLSRQPPGFSMMMDFEFITQC